MNIVALDSEILSSSKTHDPNHEDVMCRSVRAQMKKAHVRL